MTEELPTDLVWDIAFEAMRALGPPATATARAAAMVLAADNEDPPDPVTIATTTTTTNGDSSGGEPWQTKGWADGPAVAKLVTDRLNGGSLETALGATTARVVCAWRQPGKRARLDAIDRVLVAIGAHVSALPHGAFDVDPPRNASGKDGGRPPRERRPGPHATALKAPACRCPRPLPGRDEDGDHCCLHCGRRLDVALALVA